MELISALAADDWTSVSFVADFDRTLGLEKLVGCNSNVLGETDFMRFDNRVTIQNLANLEIIKNFLLIQCYILFIQIIVKYNFRKIYIVK